MSIYYVKEVEDKHMVVPSLKFETDDGDSWATLYIDHIPVAYFCNRDGTLNLLSIEIGPFTGGDQSNNKDYLESKGFKLIEKPHSYGEAYRNYYINVE